MDDHQARTLNQRRALQLGFMDWLPAPDDTQALGSDDWFTPPELIEQIRDFFGGEIDLDPCAHPAAFVHAKRSYTIDCDGLSLPWTGPIGGPRIFSRFINPPYSKPRPWIEAIAGLHRLHPEPGHTIALIKCDPSTRAWKDVWSADAILFFDRRVAFVQPGKDGRQGAKWPCALCYWGANAEGFADWFEWMGHIVLGAHGGASDSDLDPGSSREAQGAAGSANSDPEGSRVPTSKASGTSDGKAGAT